MSSEKALQLPPYSKTIPIRNIVITQYPMDFYFLGVRLKVDIRLWISDDYPFSGRVNASAFSVR